jgi:Glycosyl transferase family 2
MLAPAVSCITFADRSCGFFEQSLRYFLRQDLAEKELLVVTQTDTSVEEENVQIDDVRFLYSSPGVSRQDQWRGALESCRGRYIALWDCGDWIGSARLSSQVRQLMEAKAATCVAREVACYCPRAARAWILNETMHSWLCRKTLVFDRLFPGLDPQALAVGLENGGVPNEPRQPITRVPAPWYVAILPRGGSSCSRLDRAHFERIPVGEIAKTIWRDREFYAGLRLRAEPKPRGTLNARSRNIRVVDRQRTPKPAPIPAAPTRVSCLMATHDRRRFLPQAIQCFADQDYDCRELIIVDDGPEPIEDLIPRDPHIQYLWLRSRRSIGAKRNLAAEVATGEYFICWDDDDWFGPHRITYQVTPMLTQRSDATVLLTGYMLDLIGNSFWRQDSVERTGLFRQGASWGTLAWSRKWWKKGVRFPDGSLGEDVALQELLVRHGARIVRLPNEGASIYVRHGKNSWQFPFNKAYAEGWRVIDPPPFLPESALRYYGFSPQQSCLPRGELLPEQAGILTQQIRKVVNA